MINIELSENDARLLQYYMLKSYMKVYDNDLEVANIVGEEALCGCELAKQSLSIRNECLNQIRCKLNKSL